MVATLILSISVIILAEAVGFLAYKLHKVSKELEESENTLDTLAECVLDLSKQIPRVEIVDNPRAKSTDFNFPNNEGF